MPRRRKIPQRRRGQAGAACAETLTLPGRAGGHGEGALATPPLGLAGEQSRHGRTKRRLFAQRIDNGLEHPPGPNEFHGRCEILAQDAVFL